MSQGYCHAYIIDPNANVSSRIERGLRQVSKRMAIAQFASPNKFIQHFEQQRLCRNALILIVVLDELASDIAQKRSDGLWQLAITPKNRQCQGQTQIYVLTNSSNPPATTALRQQIAINTDLELHIESIARDVLGRHRLRLWKRRAIWAAAIWIVVSLALFVALSI